MKEPEYQLLEAADEPAALDFESSPAFEAFIEEGLRDVDEGRVEIYTPEQFAKVLEQCIGKSSSL